MRRKRGRHELRRYAGRGEQLNAVEIEEAITQLADQLFDRANFPYAFLEAFGNKETTIKRLRAGASNKSDIGGVLQTNNIHIATSGGGDVTRSLTAPEGKSRDRESEVHSGDRRRSVRGRGFGERRNRRLHLQGISRPFRFLSAARRHHDRHPLGEADLTS